MPGTIQRFRLALFVVTCLKILEPGGPPILWAEGLASPVRLDLEMDPLDAEVLFRKEPDDDSTFPVTVVEENKRLSGRIEVIGKFTRLFLKKSLLIKLEKGYQWRGHRKISLRSMSTDPSRMRDWLAWKAWSLMGGIAPDVGYVHLYINNQPIGIFLFIEWISPSMIAKFGLGEDGELFHPNDSVYCGDMQRVNQDRLTTCWLKLAPNDKDYTSLRALIEAIHATPVAEFDRFLEGHFDLDSVINWLALNTLIGNGDTYNKNYFLYFSQKTGQWAIIPWDFDLTFGRNSDPILPYPRSVLNNNYQYFYPPELGAPNPLKEKTLQNPQLFLRFKDRMRHLLGMAPSDPNNPRGGFGWFYPDLFDARLAELETFLRKNALPERYPGAEGPSFEQAVEALRLYNQWRYALLKKQILEPNPFNTARWLPYEAFPPFYPTDPHAPLRRLFVPLSLSVTADLPLGGRPVMLVEELLARPIGMVDLQEWHRSTSPPRKVDGEAEFVPGPLPQEMTRPASGQAVRIRMEAMTERVPAWLPLQVDPLQCIQREWYLDLKTPEAEATVNIEIDYLQENSLRHELGERITDENALTVLVYQGQTWHSHQTTVNPIANILRVEGLALVSGKVAYLVACQK